MAASSSSSSAPPPGKQLPTADAWDQRRTLRPPPYRGPMRALLPGIEVGDPRIDALEDRLVSPCTMHRDARTVMRGVPQSPDPPWVDWALVKRGQELWVLHTGRAFLALTAALLQGFTIARFAEVLHHSGYAQSGLAAHDRYRATAFFILDWYRFPLDDPESPARLGLYTVRCMHSFARRRSYHLFDAGAGEGVPLSQLDLAEVLLGFSAVCLSVMEVELGVTSLTPADKAAMVHMWRLVGWHLGIEDRFNVCESVGRLDACMSDYMEWTPLRLSTCRDTTHALQRTCVEGFGTHLGLGQRYWEGFVGALQEARGFEIQYSKVRRALPGLVPLVQMRMKAIGKSNAMNGYVSRSVFVLRDLWTSHPRLAKFMARRVLPVLSAVHDGCIWPLVSLLYRLSFLLAQRWLQGLALALVAWRARRARALCT